jgi:hypothetical protein
MIRGVTDTNERPQVMDNSSATVMLGLEGMAVLAVSERDGEMEYAIQSTASTGWCGLPLESWRLPLKLRPVGSQ